MVHFILYIQNVKIFFSTSEDPDAKVNPNRVGCQEKKKVSSLVL